ncbi:hypothetical protein EZV62_024083 [Acer yangbiense]|uniref:CYTH domain-containing protein n=1 Tax=Acer yangbiense TaxID=1000413 RepID=A0A5C7H4B4_9ROSI|nr:hypothetical protein EZV62_024083 [Acer yangbiense]
MAQDTSGAGSPRRRSGLLRDQVQLVKKKDSDRYEIVPIEDALSFEKGFFIVIRACQLLAQKNDGITLVGVAGPSGAGKTIFTEKVLNFMPSVAVITMDNYNDSSRIIDGNYDDPRLTDYDTLLENIHGLKAGKSVQVPIYDFKTSSRTGYRMLLSEKRSGFGGGRKGKVLWECTMMAFFWVLWNEKNKRIFEDLCYLNSYFVAHMSSSSVCLFQYISVTVEVPSSHIVIIEGIYALSERLRPLLDLRVSVTGGVHFDLVKRVLRLLAEFPDAVYPMYKAFIEPDLQTAHIKIINKFNPFTGFQNPTYILKSTRSVTVDEIKAVMSEEYRETTEETYDIYLLPPGEDPEACQSYLRMRNRDGKYNLMFEEWVTDSPFIISPRITFEVSVRLLGGLMALGYTIATILKRSSHVFFDDRVCVKTDWLEQLTRKYVQVQGKDRLYVKYVAEQLGLEGSYIPRTYIEQIQLEKLVNDVMALPDDLKTKLSIDDDLVSSPKEALSRASADRRIKYLSRGISHSYSNQRDKNMSKLAIVPVNNRRFDGRTPESPASLANQGAINQLSEQISTLNERMDEFTSRIEELNSKFMTRKVSASQQNLALQAEACNGSGPTSLFMSGLANGSLTGSLLPTSSSSSQLARESPLMDEILLIARGQRQVMHQLDNLSNLLHEYRGERSHQERSDRSSRKIDVDSISVPLILTLAIGGLGIFLFKGLTYQK